MRYVDRSRTQNASKVKSAKKMAGIKKRKPAKKNWQKAKIKKRKKSRTITLRKTRFFYIVSNVKPTKKMCLCPALFFPLNFGLPNTFYDFFLVHLTFQLPKEIIVNGHHGR